MNGTPVNYLLHPEILKDMPLVGRSAARALNNRAEATLADDPAEDPPVSVVIRSRNEETQLAALLEDFSSQVPGGDVELIVVDNESTDGTREIAKRYGAKVVTIPRDDFTYPRSMNMGVEAATHNAVFLTVAHARLTSDLVLHAAARHFKPGGISGDKVAGVFGSRVHLVGPNASKSDTLSSMLNTYVLMRGPVKIKKAGMGVMGAVGIMISKSIWEELGHFDENRESGGEDTILAREMLAAGYHIVRDPAVLVHHSHGLGVMDNFKELLHFSRALKKPQKLEGRIKQTRQARFLDKE